MHKIKRKTLKNAYKPYDLVQSLTGKSIGLVQEVSVSSGQDNPLHQINYLVHWLVNTENLHSAWFNNKELHFIGKNLFKEIAKMSCHEMGSSAYSVNTLFSNFKD